MPDALKITDFETNTIDSAAASIDIKSAVAGLPDVKFLSFYKAIIENFKKYQKAFEEKNFNMLSKFDIEISKLIVEYFKKNQSSERLNSFLKASTDEALKQLEKIGVNSKNVTEEEAKEQIAKAIEKHKNDIITKIKEELGISKGLSDKISKTTEKVEDAAVAGTVAAINLFLKKQDKVYTQNVSKFANDIVNKLMHMLRSSGNKALDPTKNAKFLRKKHREGLSGPEELTDKDFVSVEDIIGRVSIWSKISQSIGNFNKLNLGGKLKTLFVRVPKTFSKFLGKYLLALSVVIIGAVVHGVKILKSTFAILKNVVVFGYKVLTAPLKLAYNIGSFAVKTTISFFKGIFSISKRIFDGLSKNPISKTIFSAFLGFFSTYPGAYALGWFFGCIWYSLKKKLGIGAKEDSIDFKATTFDKIKYTIFNYLDKSEEFLKSLPKYEDVKEEFKKSRLYKILNSAKDFAITVGSKLINFVTNYVVPAVGALFGLLGMVSGKDLLAGFSIYRKSKVGALVGLHMLQKSVGRIIFKGGIAGLIAAAVVGGSAFAYYTFENNREKLSNVFSKYEFGENGFNVGKSLGLNGGLTNTPLTMRKLTNGKEEAIPMANRLIDISDEIETGYYYYENHVKVLNGLFGNLDRNNAATVPTLPPELIEKCFMLNGSYIVSNAFLRTFMTFDVFTQLDYLKSALVAKQDFLNKKISEFVALTKGGSFSDESLREFERNFSTDELSISSTFAEKRIENMKAVDKVREDIAEISKKLSQSDSKKSGLVYGLAMLNKQGTFQRDNTTGNLQIFNEAGGKIDELSREEVRSLSLEALHALNKNNVLRGYFSESEIKDIEKRYSELIAQRSSLNKNLEEDTKAIAEDLDQAAFNATWKGLNAPVIHNSIIAKFYETICSILSILSKSFISNVSQYIQSRTDISNKANTIREFADFFTSIVDSEFKSAWNRNSVSIESGDIALKAKEESEKIFMASIERIKERYSESSLRGLFSEQLFDTAEYVKKLMEENKDSIDSEIAESLESLSELSRLIDSKISTKTEVAR